MTRRLALAIAALAALLAAWPAVASRQLSWQRPTFTFDPFGQRQSSASSTSTTLYHHDPEGRLLGVGLAGSPAPHTAFRYDPLGRRVAESAAGVTTLRLHLGEQVVEEYVLPPGGGAPQRRKRSFWGDGIDELLAYQWDADLDGTLETLLYPLTDAQGTVQAVADAEGTVVESYLYRPDGSFRIFGADLTRPELVLARLRQGRQQLELVFSEPVQRWGEGELRAVTLDRYHVHHYRHYLRWVLTTRLKV